MPVDPVSIGLMAGGSVLSGAANYFGQREANRTNMQIAQHQTSANMAEAQRNRSFQELEQSKARSFSSAEAKRQMDFQDRMSSTAHQRQVKDLRRAGLNPVLAATGGAQAPAGSMASSAGAGGAQGQSAGTAVQNALSSGTTGALDALRTALQATRLGADIDNVRANTAKTAKEGKILDKDVTQKGMENKIWKIFEPLIDTLSSQTNASRNPKARKQIQKKIDKIPEPKYMNKKFNPML